MYINPTKPSGHYVYHQFNITKFYVLPTQCVLCAYENKQWLFPYTTLTDWFLLTRRRVFNARYEVNRYIIHCNLSVEPQASWCSVITVNCDAAMELSDVILWLLSSHASYSWCRRTSVFFCSPLFWISHTHQHGKCSILCVLLTQWIL
jgi:hypothetical protein